MFPHAKTQLDAYLEKFGWVRERVESRLNLDGSSRKNCEPKGKMAHDVHHLFLTFLKYTGNARDQGFPTFVRLKKKCTVNTVKHDRFDVASIRFKANVRSIE